MVFAAELVNILAAGVAAGALAAVQLAVIPTLRRLPPGPSLRLHQVIHPTMHPWLPVTVVLTSISAIVLLVLRHDFGKAATSLRLAGLVCMIVVSLISELRNMPINRTVRVWPEPPPVPAEYEGLQRRWMTFNALRTVICATAFVLFAVALVLS